MIWTVLGISVGIVALFCIASSEMLLGHPLIEKYRYETAAAFVVAGIIAWFAGRHRNRKRRMLAEEGEDEKAPRTFILFDLRYWGPMLLALGCITLFIRPVQRLANEPRPVATKPRQKNAVAAAIPIETAKPGVKPPVTFPRLKLQGLFYREDRPFAIIEGHSFTVGDHIGGVEIKSIGRSRVVIELSGEVRFLDLQ